MTDPCIDQVPRDDPRIELIVNMVANAYGHRLPFKSASYATQHGRIDMARELLATLDKHQREREKPPMPRRDSRSDHMERAHADVEPRGIGSTCPHCPCTYTTECCHCDGTRTPLEDS